MKFAFDNVKEKNAFGIKIVEYGGKGNSYPIDCAIAYFRDNAYPWKINHGFHEMLYVIEGEISIEFENESVHLKKQDMFIIPPGRKHTTRAAHAEILISCTPPFDIRNVEFC